MKKIDINKFVIDHIQQIKPFDPAEPLDSMAEKAGVEPEKGLSAIKIAAEFAEDFLYQKPIKRYEQRPTPSHPKNSCKKLSEVTNANIANVNKDK